MSKFSIKQIIPVSKLQRKYSQVLDQAQKEPVLVTAHNQPQAVILNIKQFEAMQSRLEKLEWLDTLMAIKETEIAEKNSQLIQAGSVMDLIKT